MRSPLAARRLVWLLVPLAVTVAAAPACDGTLQLESGSSDGATGDTLSDGVSLDGSDAPTGCRADPDCRLASLHCYVAAGVCVPCLTDDHCTLSLQPRCDKTSHRCVECVDDRNCEDGQRCEPTTHRCVQPCGDAAVCSSSAPICDSSKGWCVRCKSDPDCTSGDEKVCETASGRCVECIGDAQCLGDERRCDATLGKCVHCLTSADCPSERPLCDPSRRECVEK